MGNETDRGAAARGRHGATVGKDESDRPSCGRDAELRHDDRAPSASWVREVARKPAPEDERFVPSRSAREARGAREPTLRHAMRPSAESFVGVTQADFERMMRRGDQLPLERADEVAWSGLASELLSKIAAGAFREAIAALERGANSKGQSPRPAGVRSPPHLGRSRRTP